jgi:hypothetical protein
MKLHRLKRLSSTAATTVEAHFAQRVDEPRIFVPFRPMVLNRPGRPCIRWQPTNIDNIYSNKRLDHVFHSIDDVGLALIGLRVERTQSSDRIGKFGLCKSKPWNFARGSKSIIYVSKVLI